MTEIQVENHLGLVGKHANSALQTYSFDIDDYDDLFQIGCIGLIKACRRSNGQNFPSYASQYIKGEILHHLRSLIGRKENGYSGRKAHYQATSTLLNIEDNSLFCNLKYSDHELENQIIQIERQTVKKVWFSQWEEKLIQRQSVEMIVILGMTQTTAAKILNCNQMHISRNFRRGLQLLKEACKKKFQDENLL